MKKLFKNLGLSLAAFACLLCAGFGAVTLVSNSVSANADVAARDYYVNGAGVRLVNDANGAGLRFHTRIATTEYESLGNFESGTLIIPEIRYDGELTLEDLDNEAATRPLHIETTGKWYQAKKDETEGFMRSTVYMYDMPQVAFGARYYARSYVKVGETITYSAISPAISMSDIAISVTNNDGAYTDLTQAQVAPYIVETVKITFNLPSGKVTKEIAYGETIVDDGVYDENLYTATWTDQYGRAVEMGSAKATIPLTLTPTFNVAEQSIVIADKAFGPTGNTLIANADLGGVTVPEGFEFITRLDSGAGLASTTVSSGVYNNTDISSYEEVRFAVKPINGYVRAIIAWNPQYGLDGDWVHFTLTQTGSNLWTVQMSTNDGAKVYAAKNQVGNTIKTLLYDNAWDAKTDDGDGDGEAFLVYANAAGAGFTLYTTEVIGTKKADLTGIPSAEATEVSSSALNYAWTYGVNVQAVTALPTLLGEGAADYDVPAGFSKVSKVTSGTGWTSSVISSGVFSELDVSNYEELWYALKTVNGKITNTQGTWKDITTVGDNSWVYFHLTQTADSVWTIEIIKNGVTVLTLENQIPAAGKVSNLSQLMDNFSNETTKGRVNIYHNGAGNPVHIYATEMLGILKDGAGAPETPDVDEDFIPEDVKTVYRNFWRYDQQDNKLPVVTDDIPKSFKNVYKYTYSSQWYPNHMLNGASGVTEDITKHTDLYFAVKATGSFTHFYVRGSSHYKESKWLYVHCQQTSAGVWTMTTQSEDGAFTSSYANISATNFYNLMKDNLYIHKDANIATASTDILMTEILGKGDVISGERIIWSAADNWMPTEDHVAIPAGFTSLFKVEDFKKDGFAKLDLDSKYDAITFGFVADKDFTFNSGYKFVKDGAETTTSIMSKLSSTMKMNIVTLTRTAEGWHVAIECKRWYSGGNTMETFEGDVTGVNSLSAVMATIISPTSGITVYVTEVRGAHICAGDSYVSNNDGTHNSVCKCGKVMDVASCTGGSATCLQKAICDLCGGEHGDFAAHTETTVYGRTVCSVCNVLLNKNDMVTIRYSIWRDDKHALSASTNEPIPVPFESIVEFNWADNPRNWSETSKDFPGWIYDNTMDLSVYSDVYLAMKAVDCEKIYLKGSSSGHYYGSDWLYIHLQQNAQGKWSITAEASDFPATTCQTGLTGTTLNALLSTNMYPTRSTDALDKGIVYMSEVFGLKKCTDHTIAEYVTNNDGTHNGVCNCGAIVAENVTCSGGSATCLQKAICDLCGGEHGDFAAHTETTVYGRTVCSVCNVLLNKNDMVTIRYSIWRDDKYALSESTNEPIPVPFESIVELNWADNPRNWAETSKDFPGWRYDNSTDLSAYSDVYFAMKAVDCEKIYLKGSSSGHYYGSDWLYIHMQQNAEGKWSITAEASDFPATTYQTGLTGTAFDALLGSNMYPTRSTDALDKGIVYMSEVFGLKKCTDHTTAEYVTNNDGTHNGVCKCGAIVAENVTCSGGSATCTQKAICDLCGGEHGELLPHNVQWEGTNYVCTVCGSNYATVNTEIEKQTISLGTNAASVAELSTQMEIDLSGVTTLTISAIKDLNLGTFVSISNNVMTVADIDPTEVFGEQTLTFTATIEGKDFDVTAPVLVVTNTITTDAGMQKMRNLLRGKTDVVKGDAYQGGTGGVGTMNGDGYYLLGNDITLKPNNGGATFTNGVGVAVYAWGSSHKYTYSGNVLTSVARGVPFVGTLDGNGYKLDSFCFTNWFSQTTTELFEGSDKHYLEGSLFGCVDGTIKNLSLTSVRLAIYANIVHSGTGSLENVYVQITDVQANSNVYESPFFGRNGVDALPTMRNVVFNYKNMNSSVINNYVNSGTAPSSHYVTATGERFVAENVAVYGFNKAWINSSNGRGNIYQDKTDAHTDGSAAGIYVEYTDGSNNGAAFSYAALDNKTWKLVNGIPMLVRLNASGTVTKPSDNCEEQDVNALDGYIVNGGTTQYYIDWSSEAGAYKAAQFIKDTMKQSTGATLGVGVADPANEAKKQIIVGTYAQYWDYIEGHENVSLAAEANYGIYLENRTIYVLAEDEQSFHYAAVALCRELFGYTETTANFISMNSNATLALADFSFAYTTSVTFAQREGANNLPENTMGFGNWQVKPFVQYESMHNALLYVNSYTGSDKANLLATDSNSILDNNNVAGEQVCYLARGNATTFGSFVDHVVSVIVEKAKLNPKMNAINFMVEDKKDYCACSACAKFANPSVPQLIFLNEVAAKLASDNIVNQLGKVISVEFFSYNSYASAPILSETEVAELENLKSSLGLKHQETKTFSYADMNAAGATYAAANSTTEYTVLKAADNLRLWWTSHEASHSFGLTHAANDHMYLALLGWIASMGTTEHIDVFMYQAPYRDYFMPLNTWQYQVEWYQAFNKLGIDNYMYNLGNIHNPADSQTAFAAFKTYIDSRAMTDCNVSFDQLKDEFFSINGYYGAAGPIMRTFFDELVSVLNAKKQDENLAVDAYVDGSQLNYVNSTDSDWSQSFFNGVYGFSKTSIVFTTKSAATSTCTVTPATNLFMYDGLTQLATLERWYGYCTNALATVAGNATYTKRVQVEAAFPEYAILLLNSTYKTTITYNSLNDTWRTGNVTATFNGSSIYNGVDTSTKTVYQQFYERIKALGFAKPSESDSWTDSDVSSLGKHGIYTFGIYDSTFKNWGITI